MCYLSIIVIFLTLRLSNPILASDELLQNGGFENGNLSNWSVSSASYDWIQNQPYSTDVIEGKYRVYINPDDHGNPIVSQDVSHVSEKYQLSFFYRPHTGESNSGVYIIGLDANKRTIIIEGKNVEILYLLTGYLETGGFVNLFGLEGVGATGTAYHINRKCIGIMLNWEEMKMNGRM